MRRYKNKEMTLTHEFTFRLRHAAARNKEYKSEKGKKVVSAGAKQKSEKTTILRSPTEEVRQAVVKIVGDIEGGERWIICDHRYQVR